MKALVVILYVTTVLVFSAFARAEMAMPYSNIDEMTLPVPVSEIIVADPQNLDLQVAGLLPDQCFPVPRAQMIQDVQDPTVLHLRLVSSIPSSICPSRVVPYKTLINLPETAQTSEIEVENKAVYLIKVDGYEFEMQVLGSDLQKVPGYISF